MSKFDFAVADQLFWMKRLDKHLLIMGEPSSRTNAMTLNKYERQSFAWDMSHEIVDELLKARDRKMNLSEMVGSDVFKVTAIAAIVFGGVVPMLFAVGLQGWKVY